MEMKKVYIVGFLTEVGAVQKPRVFFSKEKALRYQKFLRKKWSGIYYKDDCLICEAELEED